MLVDFVDLKDRVARLEDKMKLLMDEREQQMAHEPDAPAERHVAPDTDKDASETF